LNSQVPYGHPVEAQGDRILVYGGGKNDPVYCVYGEEAFTGAATPKAGGGSAASAVQVANTNPHRRLNPENLDLGKAAGWIKEIKEIKEIKKSKHRGIEGRTEPKWIRRGIDLTLIAIGLLFGSLTGLGLGGAVAEDRQDLKNSRAEKSRSHAMLPLRA